jgi:hypothetical protein
MQLYQDQSPAAVTRIVYASIHDTLSVLDYKNNGSGYGNRTRLTDVKGQCPNR